MKWLIKTLVLISPSLPVLALFIAFGYEPESLIFNREAIRQGEIWRLVSAHFVHCDFEHLLYNVIGVLSLTIVFNKLKLKEIWLSIVIGIIVVDVWIWFGMQELEYYCGLSALENSILVIGLLSFWKKYHKLSAFIIGCLAFLKISMEIIQHDSMFTQISWPPVPETHAAGFIAGSITVLFISRKVDIHSLWKNQ